MYLNPDLVRAGPARTSAPAYGQRHPTIRHQHFQTLSYPDPLIAHGSRRHGVCSRGSAWGSYDVMVYQVIRRWAREE
jgi:hypothetical protein